MQTSPLLSLSRTPRPPSHDAPVDDEIGPTTTLNRSTTSFPLTPRMTLSDSSLIFALKFLLRERAFCPSKSPLLRCGLKMGLISMTQRPARNSIAGTDDERSIYLPADDERVDVIEHEFSPTEVARAFRSSENTAPGPDRLTYHHWRSLDPSAQVLTRIFNICLHHQRVPQVWKDSTTILLPKGGDPLLPTNWRPIASSNTIYKLFMKCVAERFKDWPLRYEVLSSSQKGFMPHDGVLEHNFLMHKRFEDARTTKKELCLAWLDVTNAFGSIPHCAIDEALCAAKVGDTFRNLVNFVYEDCGTRLLTSEGLSPHIKIGAGIKQGCPLSGLLFNLYIDPVLRRVRSNSNCHNVLAFADDIALLEDSPSSLQNSIDIVFDLLHSIGLRLNPTKSMTLHISGVTPVGTRNFVLH
ncbi:retrovirus-related Pol polyprotein from type-1 retrotransposable element R2 [Caerostris darwini]|uniref:Retrovirus-related Pol polyprotein from type-1 retrotransposable element R2 n=1 Tax=Caerostris darwini TaxID=1538125 RepID=A0AAV4THG1_9ARAC|nr:retrovirus-related Pol polyprotein from type-1 retrotransposable element R2 [Caerostris darwini]